MARLSVAYSRLYRGMAEIALAKDDLTKPRSCCLSITPQPQSRVMADAIAPRPKIPASLRQSVVTGLATIASPAARLAAIPAAAQSPVGSPASECPTPAAAAAAPRNAVDGVVEAGAVDENVGFREPKNNEAGKGTVSPLGCLAMLTVAIKPEL